MSQAFTLSQDKGQLEGQVAIVTGSSRGIGRATAIALARRGATVVVNYSKAEAQASVVVDEITRIGSKAIAVRADVSRSDEVDQMVAIALQRFGRVDLLVNNAGIISRVPFLDLTEQLWDEMMAVCLKGSFLCAKAVAGIMVEQRRGRMVNLSSLNGILAAPWAIHYATAKSAIIGFTKSLAAALAPYVQVNAVAPGWIATDMTSGFSEERKQKLLTETPLRRAGCPEDVAEVVAFLAAEANFITGQVIVVDGGLGNVLV